MIEHLAHSKFEIEITVKNDDIDILGHVNNVVYLQWVQKVAVEHWYSLATKWEKDNLLWVVKRHEIDYKRSAIADDIIIAKTWVGNATDREFQRHTELIRKSDNKLLAKTLTFWCPIDYHSKKPVRVGKEVYSRFSNNHKG